MMISINKVSNGFLVVETQAEKETAFIASTVTEVNKLVEELISLEEV